MRMLSHDGRVSLSTSRCIALAARRHHHLARAAVMVLLVASAVACTFFSEDASSAEPTAGAQSTVEPGSRSAPGRGYLVAATVVAVQSTATPTPEPNLPATIQPMIPAIAMLVAVPLTVTPTLVPSPTAQPRPTSTPEPTPTPIPTPTLMSAAELPPNMWSHRPVFDGGIDLGVTYIERQPRFQRYKVGYLKYPGACPYPYDDVRGGVVCPEQDGMKRWPDAGEPVTLIAHVWNFGDTASPPFDYEWKMNDVSIAAGTHYGLASGENAQLPLSMAWPGDDDNPTVSFAVDTGDEVVELIEENNTVVDWLKGYTIGFLFSPESYESLRLSKEPGRQIQSPEHWTRNNVEQLNKVLADADLDERVRAELFFITEDPYTDPRFDPNHYQWYMDGMWRIWHHTDIYTLGGYEGRPEIDYGLLHELMHQLGVIDLYRMYIDTKDIEVPDANRPGYKAGCGTDYWPYDRMCFRLPDGIDDFMGSSHETAIGPHTAEGLKQNAGYRRGFYGEYLYDTPSATSVKVVDQDGRPLPNVGLRFFQYEEFLVDAIPEFELTTDDAGFAVLPNRGHTGIVTATGHQLQPNPFGVIDFTGINGTFVIEMHGPCINYEWLTLVELNLAYWDGYEDHAAFTKVLRCPPPQPRGNVHANLKIEPIPAEREALATLYRATDGANWVKNDNWLSNAPLGEWHGVETDATGSVVHLNLNGNGLSGEIPPEMGNLANLYSLHLSYNRLTGVLPPELGQLDNLGVLVIVNSRLTGEIPPELGNLVHLHDLHLWGNDLSGSIPPELGNLISLREFHLYDNRLTGEIPMELENLPSSMTLWVRGNLFTGCIPAGLRDISNNDWRSVGLPFCN